MYNLGMVVLFHYGNSKCFRKAVQKALVNQVIFYSTIFFPFYESKILIHYQANGKKDNKFIMFQVNNHKLPAINSLAREMSIFPTKY